MKTRYSVFFLSLLFICSFAVKSFAQTPYTITYQGLSGNTAAQGVPAGITIVTPYTGVTASCVTTSNGATTSYSVVLKAATGYHFTITSVGGSAYASNAGSRDFSFRLVNGSNTYTSAVTSIGSSSSCAGNAALTPLTVPAAGQNIASGSQATVTVLRAAGSASGGGYSWTRSLNITGVVTPDAPTCTPTSSIANDSVCSNLLPYIWRGKTINAGGTNVATDTILNAKGCDSVIHLNLFVKSTNATTVNDTICNNQLPYVWYGITLTEGGLGIVQRYLQNASGCDSIVTLNLIVRNTNAIVNDTICSNLLPYTWHGFVLNAGGLDVAIDTLLSVNGCDSTIHLNLIIKNPSSIVNDTICSSLLPYTWHGIVLNTGGLDVARDTVLGTSGCDSIIHLNLVVKNENYTVNETICSSQLPYTWHGVVLSIGGLDIARDTLLSTSGCDSIIHLNLIVNVPSNSIVSDTICSNQLPYTWHGIVLNAGGLDIAKDTILSTSGCDSILHLNLVVNPGVATAKWDVYTTANSGLINNNARVVYIDPVTKYKWVGASAGLSVFNGATWTNYTTASTTNGLPSNTIYAIVRDIQGNHWIGTGGGLAKFNGTSWTTYTTATTPSIPNNLVNAVTLGSNDSVWVATGGGGIAVFHNTDIQIINQASTSNGLPSNNITDILIDANNNKWVGTNGQGVAKFNGVNWTVYSPLAITAGITQFTGTLKLAEDNLGNIWVGSSLAGLSKYNGTTWTNYTTSSTPNTIPSNVINALMSDPNGTIWIGTGGGATSLKSNTWTTYTSTNSGLKYNVVRSIAVEPSTNVKWFASESNNGGISILSSICQIVCTPDSIAVYDTICNNQLPYIWHGKIVDAVGFNIATDTLQNAGGCDSVLHLNLIIKATSSSIVNDTICSSLLPYTWHGNILNVGGLDIARDTVLNAVGCDSIIHLNLIVKATSSSIVNDTICSSLLPYTWHGNILNAGGLDIAKDTVLNAVGCDSIIHLNLIVKATSFYTETITTCRNLPYTWNGITVSTSGINAATYHTLNSNGCDSLVSLNLTVSVDTVQNNITINSTELPYNWHDITINAGGTAVATYTLQTSTGCDSVLILNLTVIEIPTPVTLISFKGNANSDNNSLSWVASNEINFSHYELERSNDRQHFERIAKVYAQNYSSQNNYLYNDKSINGSVLYYRLKMIDIDGKFKHSNVVAIKRDIDFVAIKSYPNPTSNILNVEGLKGKTSYYVADATGRLLLQTNTLNASTQNPIKVNVSTLTKGVYFLHYQDENRSGVIRFIKK